MTCKLYGRLFVLVLSICFLCGGARMSAAESSSPSVTVEESPSEIAVDFADPLDVVFVKLQVLDASGQDHAISPPLIRADRKRVSVRVDTLEPGAFTVQWGVIDSRGHLSKGTYSFRVKGSDNLTRSGDVPDPGLRPRAAT